MTWIKIHIHKWEYCSSVEVTMKGVEYSYGFSKCNKCSKFKQLWLKPLEAERKEHAEEYRRGFNDGERIGKNSLNA